MLQINWEPLPMCVGVVVMLLIAAFQAVIHRVPNALTIPAILAGWAFSIHVDASHHAMWPGAAFQASLLGSFLALLILLPLYCNHQLGAGCVKGQMAFGAWIGCALPLLPSLTLAAGSTLAGVFFTYFVFRRKILDIPEEERANYEFPAQITLSIVAAGSVLACWIISCPA